MKRIALALALLAACTSQTSGTIPDETSTGGPASSSAGDSLEGVRIEPGGAPTAAAAIKALCAEPDLSALEPVDPAPLPAELETVKSQVESVRGLTFPEPVAAEGISDVEMERRIGEAFDIYFDEGFYDRRSAAWKTIGAIEADDDLFEALRSYYTGQVVGFYDSQTGELVFLSSGELNVTERYILSHELTHAIDDQNFDLTRLDEIGATCRDDLMMAALGVVEGSAQHFANEALFAFPPEPSELEGAFDGLGDSLAGLDDVPAFLQALQEWPYTIGQLFVDERAGSGGTTAVDEALVELPMSTEQVIHPELYGVDEPTEVDVPDLSGELGKKWGDLDAMEVGEAWLYELLHTWLAAQDARLATAGWDGGVYRAFSDGADVVVVMETAWDTEQDAEEFADGLDEWASVNNGVESQVDGDRVTSVFTSDEVLVSRVDFFG